MHKGRAKPVGSGRKAWAPSDDERKTIMGMISVGCTRQQVAKHLGITDDTLIKHLGDELDRAEVNAIATVAKTLYQKATNGDLGAAIFYLKARAGWRENERLVLNEGGGLNITLNLGKFGS